MDKSSVILELCGISYKKNRKFLFKEVHIELNVGQSLYITGENGSGKTTLMKVLLGFIPLYAGKILYKHQPIQHVLKSFYQNIIYIGHENALISELSVVENINFFGALNNQKISKETLSQALKNFKLTPYRHQKISMLSQGQKKRVALTKLVILNKKIWILDEPFVSLDTQGKDTILKLFEQQIASGGMIIFTSHIPLSWDTSSMVKLALCS